MHTKILGTGSYLPVQVRSNQDLEQMVETSDQWIVERTGISLFLVSHLRRTQSDQNHEEGARVTLGQLRGSAAIAQLSDTVIALERDQQNPDKQNSTTVRVLKNRHSGEVGVANELIYDLRTCTFTEHEVTPDFDPTTDFG